jgi:hypothetical protein
MGWKYDWVDPLGTPSKGNQETKIGQIIFLGLFFKCFHNYKLFFLMFIYCMPKYMAWSFHYNKKKAGNCYEFVFLVDVALLGIKFLHFGNS